MESTVGPQPVRLFLVGLSEGLARSVARYISSDPCIALVGVAPSIALASMLLSSTRSELALLDCPKLGELSRSVLDGLRFGCPGLRIVCMASETHAYRPAASQAGFDAVLSQDDLAKDLDALLRALFPERRLV